jgi:hypothetical protein
MIKIGDKHGRWTVIKPSGIDKWEISSIKKVLRVSSLNIESGDIKKKNYTGGELMYNITVPKKPKTKKKTHVKINKTLA